MQRHWLVASESLPKVRRRLDVELAGRHSDHDNLTARVQAVMLVDRDCHRDGHLSSAMPTLHSRHRTINAAS